jgi:signal peptidase II
MTDQAAEPPVETIEPPPDVRPLRRVLGLPAITAVIVPLVVAADQLTKHWAVNSLADQRSRHVFWTLQWNLSFNSGMAFSQAQGIGPIIGVLALVVIAGLALSARKLDSTLLAVAMGLIAAGAIGNLSDRVFRGDAWLRGAVVDFIDFQWFPIFNIADSAITIGGVLFVVWSLLNSEPRRR